MESNNSDAALCTRNTEVVQQEQCELELDTQNGESSDIPEDNATARQAQIVSLIDRMMDLPAELLDKILMASPRTSYTQNHSRRAFHMAM